MHGAHPNNDYGIMIKLFANFPLCGGCSRRERREELEDEEYYCAIADSILPKGNVTNDTDATNCVRNGWYIPCI
jgi:hypothetical protein